MLKKWHKVILIKEIDYDSVPSSIRSEVMDIDNTAGVLEYEDLFVELGFDFDDILTELEQVEEEGRQNYIYQLFVDSLPKKQELKNIEKSMAKFDLWNYLASTLNPNHKVEEYSKKLDDEYIQETLEEWKQEKVSRVVALRERLQFEKEARRIELLNKRKEKEISKAEEEELEYIEEMDDYGANVFSDNFMGDFSLGNDVEFNAEDAGMSEINLDGDFSDFAPGNTGDTSFGEEETNFEMSNTEVVEDKVVQPQSVVKNNIESDSKPMDQSTQSTQSTQHSESKKEVKTETVVEKIIEKVEVEKFVTDPKLEKKIEDKEQEIKNILSASQERLEREKQQASRAIEDKEHEIEQLREQFNKTFNEHSEHYEEQLEDLEKEIEGREDEIKNLQLIIEDHVRQENDRLELQTNLAKAATFDELLSMRKGRLRELADQLTITYSKFDKKEVLITKLMSKAEKLNRVYNSIDLEEEVKRRLEASKNMQEQAEELGLDPFKETTTFVDEGSSLFGSADPFANFSEGGGMDDMFGGGADPFSNLEMGGGMDDMFSGGADPFSNVNMSGGMDDEFSGSSDPFANVKTSGGMDDEFGGGTSDPFANMKSSSSGMDDEFGSGSSDPFSNLKQNSSGMEDEFASEKPIQNIDKTQSMTTEFLSDDMNQSSDEEQNDEKPNKKKKKMFGRK